MRAENLQTEVALRRALPDWYVRRRVLDDSTIECIPPHADAIEALPRHTGCGGIVVRSGRTVFIVWPGNPGPAVDTEELGVFSGRGWRERLVQCVLTQAVPRFLQRYPRLSDGTTKARWSAPAPPSAITSPATLPQPAPGCYTTLAQLRKAYSLGVLNPDTDTLTIDDDSVSVLHHPDGCHPDNAICVYACTHDDFDQQVLAEALQGIPWKLA